MAAVTEPTIERAGPAARASPAPWDELALGLAGRAEDEERVERGGRARDRRQRRRCTARRGQVRGIRVDLRLEQHRLPLLDLHRLGEDAFAVRLRRRDGFALAEVLRARGGPDLYREALEPDPVLDQRARDLDEACSDVLRDERELHRDPEQAPGFDGAA